MDDVYKENVKLPADFATGTISSANISFFSYCFHTKPCGLLCFSPVTLQLGLSLLETQASSLIVYTPKPGVCLQLGLSLLETQASSLIVYTPNPGVCYVDFATWTISSGNTSFFSYCVHTKPWGLLCFPLWLCNLDYLFWKHKLLLLLFTHQTLGSVMFPPVHKLLLLLCTHQTLGSVMFPPVTLQLGLSLLETQASSLIVYTPNPGVCQFSL